MKNLSNTWKVIIGTIGWTVCLIGSWFSGELVGDGVGGWIINGFKRS